MIPHELTVFLVSASPILELRGGMPLAIFTFGFSPIKAYLWSVAGNLFPLVPYFIFLERFSAMLMHRFYAVNRFLTWLFERTRRIHGNHFDYFRWAPFALFVFVAVPLPFTGAWSGVLAAVVFGIPFRAAITSIALGVASSGVIMLAFTTPLALLFS